MRGGHGGLGMPLEKGDLSAPWVRRDLRAWLVEISATSSGDELNAMDGRPGALDRFLDSLDGMGIVYIPEGKVGDFIYRDELPMLEEFAGVVEAGIDGDWDGISGAATALLKRMDGNETSERPHHPA